MKQSVSPTIAGIIIAVVVVVVGFFAYKSIAKSGAPVDAAKGESAKHMGETMAPGNQMQQHLGRGGMSGGTGGANNYMGAGGQGRGGMGQGGGTGTGSGTGGGN